MMKPIISKIALVVAICLLGMNFVTGAGIAVEPCPPSNCCGGSMQMDACNDMIHFARPIPKCCDDCADLFCGLLNDPLQNAKPVQPSPEMGYPQLLIADYVHNADQTCDFLSGPQPWPDFFFMIAAKPIPLYIENLCLII
jgi:hypothetical protein